MKQKEKDKDTEKGVLDTSDDALVDYLSGGQASMTDSPVSSISSLFSEINFTDKEEKGE